MTPQKLLFIVGSGRSGTTLLRNIIERQGDFGVSPELKFFDYSYASRYSFGNLKTVDDRRHFAEFTLSIVMRGDDPLIQRIRERQKTIVEKMVNADNPAQIFLSLLKETSSNADAPILVEKTPASALFLKQIVCFFPDAYVVHVVRDSRTFAASALKRKWFKNVIEASAFWNTSLCAVECGQHLLQHGHYLEIRYEDLVADTKKELDRFFAFLSLSEPSPAFFEGLKTLPAFSSFMKNESAGIYAESGAGDYLSKDEQNRIASLTRRLLAEKGYSFPKERATSRDLLFYIFYAWKLLFLLWFKHHGLFGWYEQAVKKFSR